MSGASVETSDEEVVSAPADGLDEFVVRNETAVLQSNQDEEQFDSIIQPTKEEHPSRYSAELDKIRAALTSDNIDISSIDQPIALDDYSDDENVEEESSGEFTEQLNPSLSQALDNSVQETSVAQSDDEWEWEYVDENGNPIEGAEGDEEWEWEYVEDDGSTDEGNNK